MNERIKQLAEKAAGTKKYVPPVWQFYDHELENFADLIIQECVKAVYEHDIPKLSGPSISYVNAILTRFEMWEGE